MRVSIVTMAFPWPSETFAARDFRALRARGASITVHQLRRKLPSQDALAHEQGVADVPARHPSIPALAALLLPGGPGLGRILRLALRIARDRDTAWRERVRCLVLLPFAAQVARRVMRERPDVLHLYWGHYPAMVTVLLRGRLPGTMRTMFLGAYDLERGLGVSRWAAAESRVVYTHAHANVPALRAVLGPDADIVVAHRGIDLSPYPPVAELARTSRGPTVLSAGRLIPNKGVDRVLEAFARILERHPDARLRIAGDGPARAELEAAVARAGMAHAVTFLGWLGEEEVRREMMAAKIFLMLSRKSGERLPNVVKEAMASGCVCVVSRSPGIDELIEDGVDGWVIEGDAPGPVAEVVGRHLGVERFEPMQERAAGKIRRAFDAAAAAEAYLGRWREGA